MSKNRTVIFVHGVGPAEDGLATERFLEGQVDIPLQTTSGRLAVAGNTYPVTTLDDKLELIESGWAKFRPVQRTTFSIFYEILALLWGMLQLVRYEHFEGSLDAERKTNTLGKAYSLSFLVLLFWCIHPAILSLFYATDDFLALVGWVVALTFVICLLSSYDRIFWFGILWLVPSIFGLFSVWLGGLEKNTFVVVAALAYAISQGIVITLGWLYMFREFWTHRRAPQAVRAARLALAFVPFFAAGGVGALVWTLALARVQANVAEVNSFDDWAQTYSSAIPYPIFNAELYNGSTMFGIGCLLIAPAAIVFLTSRSKPAAKTAAIARKVFTTCLTASGILVLVLIPLFWPAVHWLGDVSQKFGWLALETAFTDQPDAAQNKDYIQGGDIFAAYALWAGRILPFVPIFFGAFAVVLKILGDIVFYLLPPSEKVVARKQAVAKLKAIVQAKLSDGGAVIIISHSQGTMIALDAVQSLINEGGETNRLGLWLSGSPSVALYKDFLQLNRLDGPLPLHMRNFYRRDDVIASSIEAHIPASTMQSDNGFEEFALGNGGHTNYWKEFDIVRIREAFALIT